VPAAAAVGPTQVRVRVAGVGTVRVTLRVVATTPPTPQVAHLLAPVVPLAAMAASTAADPADTASLQVVNSAGAPTAYPGALVWSATFDGGPLPPDSLAVTLAPTPGDVGAFTLSLFAGPRVAVGAGTYRLTIGPAPGSPPLAPVTLTVVVLAPTPGAGAESGRTPPS
jgi:hypothetical protein